MRGLRVEEPAPKVVTPPPAQTAETDWRKLAIQTGDRLQYAETQLRDLRKSTDELRARLNKAKERNDTAQARVNELQAQVVTVTAKNEVLEARVLTQDQMKEVVHALVYDVQQALLKALERL